MSTSFLLSPEVDRLSTLLEEAARAGPTATYRFVEPAQGTLSRAKSARHHIVFGRRGSGKTSLLLKAAEDLGSTGCPVAYVDLERFKGQRYPDVLVSVLIATFQSFGQSLSNLGPKGDSPKATLLSRLLRRRPPKPISSVEDAIRSQITDLQELLVIPDDVDVKLVEETSEARTRKAGLSVGVPSPLPATVSGAIERTVDKTTRGATEETARRSKVDTLRRSLMGYSALLKDVSVATGKPAFLFLDDLYHIRRADQPYVLDYLHGLVKGTGIWMKVGTIRHRSAWYLSGDPPYGLKLRDDADEINLDLTLERFARARVFLMEILSRFVSEANAPSTDGLLVEGAIDRLVLASGGVARDFLGLLRGSIDQARDRLSKEPADPRQRIGAEDVNLAAGEYGASKEEEFKIDSFEDSKSLEESFRRVARFCTEKANANCFLVDQSAPASRMSEIDELVDLRLVHLINSRITVRGRTGKIYRAFMLDLSQYAGERKRRGFEMVPFWSRGGEERLRNTSLIYIEE